jgi:AraC-like DNA-binding protein
VAIIPLVQLGGAARAAVRRGIARRARVVSCREFGRLDRLLAREVVDAVVVNLHRRSAEPVFGLIGRFPGIPVFAVASFRPEDGRLLLAGRRAGVCILQSGVDDPVSGEVIAARTASRRRRTELRDAPSLLRLTEPIQLRIWDAVLRSVGSRARTGDLARQLGLTREHLSREFAAGGAPNLKRVIDLARICCAADLLVNPGYDVRTVGRVLRFASPSHLATSARRIAGVTPRELPRLGARQVLSRFLKGRTRSRL